MDVTRPYKFKKGLGPWVSPDPTKLSGWETPIRLGTFVHSFPFTRAPKRLHNKTRIIRGGRRRCRKELLGFALDVIHGLAHIVVSGLMWLPSLHMKLSHQAKHWKSGTGSATSRTESESHQARCRNMGINICCLWPDAPMCMPDGKPGPSPWSPRSPPCRRVPWRSASPPIPNQFPA